MTTYRELKAQIDVLQRKAEEVRKGEIAELVAENSEAEVRTR